MGIDVLKTYFFSQSRAEIMVEWLPVLKAIASPGSSLSKIGVISRTDSQIVAMMRKRKNIERA